MHTKLDYNQYFIDAIDDNNPSLYDSGSGTLVQMMRNTTHPNRLTSSFLNVVYPNVFIVETRGSSGDQTKPDIDVTKLYTFDMIASDALVFRTDIPHIGFPPSIPGGLRMSLENRYAFVVKDFDIATVFKVEPIKEGETCAVTFEKKPERIESSSIRYGTSVSFQDDQGNWRNGKIMGIEDYSTVTFSAPRFMADLNLQETEFYEPFEEIKTTTPIFGYTLEVVDGYTPLPYQNELINGYFRIEFKRFAEVYKELTLDIPLTIDLFQRFMDATPYDSYYFEMAESRKILIIRAFLQTL